MTSKDYYFHSYAHFGNLEETLTTNVQKRNALQHASRLKGKTVLDNWVRDWHSGHVRCQRRCGEGIWDRVLSHCSAFTDYRGGEWPVSKCQHHSLKEGGGSRMRRWTSSSRSGWGTGITFSTSLCWRRCCTQGQVAQARLTAVPRPVHLSINRWNRRSTIRLGQDSLVGQRV